MSGQYRPVVSFSDLHGIYLDLILQNLDTQCIACQTCTFQGKEIACAEPRLLKFCKPLYSALPILG